MSMLGDSPQLLLNKLPALPEDNWKTLSNALLIRVNRRTDGLVDWSQKPWPTHSS